VRCAPNWALAAGLASFIFPATARPQIAFTNLAETRIGRDPDDARILPSDLVPSASRASLFDQFSLDWTRGPLRLGFRFEMYRVGHAHRALRGIQEQVRELDGRALRVHVFWGQRRGGLACTAGTCYKVRGFEGVSARLVSRF